MFFSAVAPTPGSGIHPSISDFVSSTVNNRECMDTSNIIVDVSIRYKEEETNRPDMRHLKEKYQKIILAEATSKFVKNPHNMVVDITNEV